MSLWDRIRTALGPQRSVWPQSLTVDDYAAMLSSGGYPLSLTSALQTSLNPTHEDVEGNFAGLVVGAYQRNGVVFACLMTRFLLFSEARFQYQSLRGGVAGDLFGTPELAMLEHPEPGKTTGDMLAEALIDADLSGDWFGLRRNGGVRRLRPDWTTIVIGSPRQGLALPAWDPDAQIVGYIYTPGGPYSGNDPMTFSADEVAHFAPIRDPLVRFRGMPLPTAVLRDVMGDTSATRHKLAFFDNAATPNLVIKFPPMLTEEKARKWIEIFEQEHTGSLNAFRTAYLGAGADATVVGTNLQELDFSSTQGAGESRIAAALGVHPTIVGLSEGLKGSSLNAGNFGAARRLTADKTLRPLWRNMSGSLETIVPPPNGASSYASAVARLWIDEADIPFLREDVKDAAEVVNLSAQAIRTLTDGGYQPQSVLDAITSGDLKRLVPSGLFSVQLQPPGTTNPPPATLPPARDLQDVRCPECDHLAGRASGAFETKCRKCGTLVAA